MRKILFTLAAAMACNTLWAQPRYDKAKMVCEKLNRGVVAIRQDGGSVVVSWRTLSSDTKGQPFDVYRNGQKLTDTPLTTGGTFFIDTNPTAGEAVYEVKGGGLDGSFTLKADAPKGYLPITLQKPEGGTCPDGSTYTYSANDASVGDVDGDGQYEIFLKWDPSNARDNAHQGFTGNTLIDCYRLDGTRLWRIDLGRNIRSGAHYVPFMVYDFDGDGKAELMVKTADGTIDGTGRVIGSADADWREGAAEAQQWYATHKDEVDKQRKEEEKRREEFEKAMREGRRPEGMFPGRPPRQDGQNPQQGERPDPRQQDDEQGQRQRQRGGRQQRRMPRQQFGFGGDRLAGRILKGPEYITVFDGLTGHALDTADYIPERGETMAWGDDNGNRSERYLAGVGYLDGQKASALFCRGYYTRTVIAAWDWDGKKLENRWTFDTNNPEWSSYAGQGNHNLRIADVDGDGCDEIIYGAMAVDNDGRGLYNTGMGHGDAMHMTVFDPTSDRLQVWDCHENHRDGSELHDAATGEVVFQLKSNTDVGRCMAADIDPESPGVEMWSSDSHGIRDIKGNVVSPKAQAEASSKANEGKKGKGKKNSEKADGNYDMDDNTALYIGGQRLSTNFGIWWDGDLLRELLDHESVSKYDWQNGVTNTLYRFDGCSFNNGSKSNPCLSADILGDWREEVLLRTKDSSELRLYVSPVPTDHRINCLMEDIPYRLSVATENVGYNQPPETGFYLGPDKSVVDFLK